ncbi:chitobiosyldiphosphodolichol beta-mannosyltransferase [Biomphalaria glabrata]|uniref:Chitobiosyldiphosphodolichol beta-mannosyltransferase n=1 Tax=Biomphalaria glabrata TaxID=6526 RepID=A0A2C9JFT1_BIOGL|nr:chitobiosyldiphosphodolichol beta-mannosyltransferase-like [Biomphalaria glabrata]KAI8796896.1 chitobiosyldiphosphodolichol beta-mannosyltransferase [Biomphalaria glabrata]
MSLTSDILFYTPLLFVCLYLLLNKIVKTPRNICIVVLGDIGRSPRMQYHAMSFAMEGFRVYLVGYRGSKPHEQVLKNEQITLHHMQEPPLFITKLPKLLGYAVKVIWQSVMLAWTLLLLPNMSSIFIQNPPSIPTMLISYIVSRIRFSTLVIDWHNYGYTILAMALRPGHPLVTFSKWYEKKCGGLASYNFCVTNAMKEDLLSHWNIRAITAHDKPSEFFQTISLEQQHNLFCRLSKEYPVFASQDNAIDHTKFTQKNTDGTVAKVDGRPALLMSSTSWTEDEDFGLLLDALKKYDQLPSTDTFPDLVCVISGKGPQKIFYTQQIADYHWKKVKFCLPWLAAEDYPLMLGSADIGVCLHKSSSGLDLPMKVVDMFGCGLPVCAVNFQCIGELVHHDENGLLFHDSEELFTQLKDLLFGFPKLASKLKLYRENLASFQKLRWHSQWRKIVLPIFYKIGGIQMSAFDLPGFLEDNDFDEEAKKEQ